MLSATLRSHLGALPRCASAADLVPFAEELAQLCRQRAQPRKSLAMYMRNIRDVIPRETLAVLSEMVIGQLERAAVSASAPASSIVGRWMDITEAARVLGLQRVTLTERLKLAQYRYLYGWPYWDGHQWWLSSSALDPATRVEYLARLPQREPEAHVSMLPSWCVRQATAAETSDSRSGTV